MFEKKADGTYRFSTRFWVYTSIATIIIVWIGWRTQATANQVEAQATSTTQFAADTNDCLKQVIDVLTTRVGYNDKLDALDYRREAIWDALVDALAASDNSKGLNEAALMEFQKARAQLREDRAKLIAARSAKEYPRCAQLPPPEAPK